MAALNQTTLGANVGMDGLLLALTNVATVAKGDVLYLDREAVTVTAAPVAFMVRVSRGALGTVASPHGAGAVVYTGPATKFKTTDPVAPPIAFEDSPWINVANGNIWSANGDDVGPGVRAKYWALSVATHTIGALGSRNPPLVAS